MGEDGDRRAAILRAAFEEFAAKGFRGATIKSIARAAGLQSPALIYWYFPAKEALFAAVLERHTPILRAMAEPDALLDRPPEEVLPLLGQAYLTFTDQPTARRLLRLLVGEVARGSGIAEVVARRGPGRVLGFLQTYLARQVELGRLRPHDTRAGARAFIGMLIPQIAGTVFLPALQEGAPTNDEHLATAVAIFLRGLQPEQSAVDDR